ncbi:Diphthine methyltransferase [Penicillium rolfsii]|nr:Diphthine methyltransferase [Penicillium rolfsii]
MAEVQRPKAATTIFLDQPPSCLEFCPDSPDHFVVGTYLLSETKNEADEVQQTKTGSVQLWRLDPITNNLSLVQKVSLPYAVFDLHFHPRDTSKFAIASSTGCISLFEVSATEPSIHQIWTKPVHENASIPALFLAWASKNWFSEPDADGFAVTFSDSRTTVFGTTKDITDGSAFTEWGSFEARQMIEVWFVALAEMQVPGNGESKVDTIPFMFTGNDFGSLHTRRFECHETKAQDYDAPLANILLEHDDRARHHNAGVTSILPLPVSLVDDAPILLTGSYDEGLRVYHATRRGEVLAEEGLGGGVWRLQLLKTKESGSERYFWVLASCMHAGTRVVKVTQTQQDQTAEWGIEVLAEFTEHESMNYASDVWKGARSSELLCVSSSFYDRRVCVWRAKI